MTWIMNARDSEGYSDSKGIFSARKGHHAVLLIEEIPNVDIDDIYLGNGVSELIVMSMQGLLDNGDEVLVPMPDYPLWTAAVSLAGEMPFTISVMKLQNGTQILTISSQKSLPTPRQSSLSIKQPNWSPLS